MPHSAADRITNEPKLLSGGNPQIARGDSDAPAQQSIVAMSGLEPDVGHHLEELAVRTVPDVPSAVGRNWHFYGIEGRAGS